MDIVIEALGIFLLRVLGITVSTLATILTVQGRKLPAIITGSLSTFVYVVAIGRVVNDLNNAANVAAYVIGFGVGTWVGMVLEGRMALGYAEVRIISTSHGNEIANALREAGFGVTQTYGRGQDHAVAIIDAFVPRKSVAVILKKTEEKDDKAIVAVSEARQIQGGYWRLPDRRR